MLEKKRIDLPFVLFLSKEENIPLFYWKEENIPFVLLKRREYYLLCYWKEENIPFVLLKRREYTLCVIEKKRIYLLLYWKEENIPLALLKRREYTFCVIFNSKITRILKRKVTLYHVSGFPYYRQFKKTLVLTFDFWTKCSRFLFRAIDLCYCRYALLKSLFSLYFYRFSSSSQLFISYCLLLYLIFPFNAFKYADYMYSAIFFLYLFCIVALKQSCMTF